MNPLTVLFAVAAVLSGSALAQLPPSFFTSGLRGGFGGFSGFASPQVVGTPVFSSGSGRSNTGTTVQGPILFPPAPESRDTSGVVVGASGYGFVPPGVNEILQGRGFPSSSSSSSSSPSSTSALQSSLGQAFGNFYQL